MPTPNHFKDRPAEKRLFSWRLLVLILLLAIMVITLIARMAWLQWIQHDHFRAISTDNRIQTRPIAPPRGLILDRNGHILADNKPDLSVTIVPEQVNHLDKLLAKLGQLIQLNSDDIERFKKRLRAPRHPGEPVLLRSRISDKEAARLAASQFQLPGTHIEADVIRHYPYGKLFSHTIGYVSRISTRDLKAMTPDERENYRGTHFYGRTGLERYYESRLHGKVGYQQVEVNAKGRTLSFLNRQPPKRGKNLQLYLDLAVQKTAWKALGVHHGGVVAIDPRSGGVLALVSRPGFNPNLFVTGISYKKYHGLQTNPGRPLFNRALQGQYPPGSTIKPFLGLAGLANGVTNWQKTIYDPGYFKLPHNSHIWRDWKHYGHGIVDLEKAIQVSCDVYFYTLGAKLGIDRIDQFLDHFKFGKKTGIDLHGEANGILPSPQWKRAHRGHPWYKGDTVNVSIGQGYMLVTPLQLATATAILARDGHTMSPRLADIKGREQPATGGKPLLDNPLNWKRMREAMIAVTSGPRGTARYISRGAKYTIAGKTGTAQVFSLNGSEYNAKMIPKSLRDHSLFIGFAPADKPAIVVAVLIAHESRKGLSASSIARHVMDAWLLDKNGNLAIPPAEPPAVSRPLLPAAGGKK